MTAPVELSRPFPTERIERGGAASVVEATPAECASVAGRLLLPAVGALRCAWTLRPAGRGTVIGEGRLQAAVTQTCVVTLEPFDQHVSEAFTVHFVLQGREAADEDPDAPDELPYDGLSIDLGEAAVEQLALALDPYPRRPGAELAAQAEAAATGGFAALAKRRALD